MPRRNPTWFSVNPTFSAGSGAQVPEETAVRVAKEEAQAFLRACSGIYGQPAAAQANLRGTAGIVYSWTEKGQGAVVTDLLTEEVRTFKKFADFQAWGKSMRDASAHYRRVEYGGTAEAKA